MGGYLARAAPVPELISGLLKDRRADEAAQLAEYALGLGLDACENVDDSDGELGQLFTEIGALHLKTCKAARPDGEALAKRLFELQLRDDWGFFRVEDYAPLLGKSGMGHYRKLAEAAWSKVPALKPGDREPWDEERRFTLTAIMETLLARRDGDVDRLIEIKSRDLTSPHSFFEIAELLAKVRRREEAIEWAERGHKAFRGEPHEPLVEILLWDGDPDAALAEASAGGCSQPLWLKLAEALEKDSLSPSTRPGWSPWSSVKTTRPMTRPRR
ncbi:MAG: DUF6880 family protein [Pseudomonadota bacterium]